MSANKIYAMDARRGLHRYSYATYSITGHGKTYLIRRNGRGTFLVGESTKPLIPGFFSMKFRRLRDARAFAEELILQSIKESRPREKPARRVSSPENLAFLVLS